MTRIVCLVFAWMLTIAAAIGAFLAARYVYILYSVRPELADPMFRAAAPFLAAIGVFLAGLLPAVWFFVQARVIELLSEIRDQAYRGAAPPSPQQQAPRF